MKLAFFPFYEQLNKNNLSGGSGERMVPETLEGVEDSLVLGQILCEGSEDTIDIEEHLFIPA